MRTALRRMGNSAGMIIPKPILAEIGATVGAVFDVLVEKDRLILAPLSGGPRAGWAEAAEALGKNEDESVEWQAFGNEGDSNLEW